VDPVAAQQDVTSGRAAIRKVGRHPGAIVPDTGQALGELDLHAVLDRLLPQDLVERSPLDQQQSLGVAAQALAPLVHELDARRRGAGGVDLAADAQDVEDGQPIRREVEEGAGLVLRFWPAFEDGRASTPARRRNMPRTGPAMPPPTTNALRVPAAMARHGICLLRESK
jgi:hypothetical protein